MKFKFLIILGFFLNGSVKAQNLSSVSAIKLKIDSVRNFIYTGPSTDLIPTEFNAAALENEYYSDTAYLKGHISVLRLRNNNTLIYETYYKPYEWARIQFRIGNYCISGDTIFIKYRPLLEGKPGLIYVSPILRVSWIPPAAPEYLLINKVSFFDPYEQRPFYILTDKPQFIFETANKTGK